MLKPAGQSIVIPGKMGDPKLLIVQSSWVAPVRFTQSFVNWAIVNGWSIVLKAFSRINPKVSLTLRLDFTICVWEREITWLPASRC